MEEDHLLQRYSMTVQVFYNTIFVISILLSAIYVYIWHKHYNSSFTMIFTLVPVACLGYKLYVEAMTLESAVIAMQIIYIGGCFLQLFIDLSMINLCNIEIPGYLRAGMFLICALCYGSILTIGKSDLFYKNISFVTDNGYGNLVREYGPMHTVFYVVLALLFAVGIFVIIFSWFRKKQVPRRILLLLLVLDTICIVSFFFIRRIMNGLELVPVGYCLAEAIFLRIGYRVNLYDVTETVIASMVHERSIGYISVDFRYRYLGSNDIAKMIIPELDDLRVDEKIRSKTSMSAILEYIDCFRKNPSMDTFEYIVGEEENDPGNVRIYAVNVNYLFDGTRRRGYIITFADDTARKRYIRLLDRYNEDLHREVEKKTEHIVVMQDNLIMSLAMMVESRDNSTGGHIKRTSEGVRILVDEIRKDGAFSLSEDFCEDVVKAAPMHDLGKIAVDDAILRKPGKFTPEEYEKMKAHAAEGARVIHEVLKDIDDSSFKVIAENVAHYHHERWDGSGYPEHLSGEEIPIEARIMAVADVYDALVSRRVYKDAYDYEKANMIILEGMGTQFDPGMRTIYEKARPALENYYNQQP